MKESPFDGLSSLVTPEPMLGALLVFVLLLVWSFFHLSNSIRILAGNFLSSVTTDFDVELTPQSTSDEEWLNATVAITAVENPAIYLGGCFRLYDSDSKKFLDMPLHNSPRRAMMVGQGFLVPICVRLPMDDQGTPNIYHYDGYILCSDARSLGFYKVSFGDLRGYETKRISRAHSLWLRLGERRKEKSYRLLASVDAG